MGERWQLFPKWPRTGVTGSSMVSKGDFLVSVTAHILPQRGLRLLRRQPRSSKATMKKARKVPAWSHTWMCEHCSGSCWSLLYGHQCWDMRKWSEAESGKVQTKHKEKVTKRLISHWNWPKEGGHGQGVELDPYRSISIQHILWFFVCTLSIVGWAANYKTIIVIYCYSWIGVIFTNLFVWDVWHYHRQKNSNYEIINNLVLT